MATRDLLIIVAAVLLLRLPFLNQAVQGDESTFLASAEHAQIDPLHPNHTHYIFTDVERDVDLEGGSHMPLDAWVLAGLIAIFGSVKEAPFHAFYIVFSLLAALAMYGLARRFSTRPLWATLLFLAVPAFVVNGGGFEADVPHLAFFLCGMACFITAADRRSLAWLGLSAVFLVCAALTVIWQPQIGVPILLVYVWLYARDWKAAWIAALVPSVTLVAWEVFERATSGVFPIVMTFRYVNEQGWDKWAVKRLNTEGLLIHLWFIVFPLLFAAGVWLAWRRRNRDTAFLGLWIGIYLAAACEIFSAGSARYLLPIAAPVAIWASFARESWVVGGFVLQMALSLGLAIEDYQHWNAYREFAQEVVQHAAGHRTWINSEWGLRHYMEDGGARVPNPGQLIPPGDVVVWSELVHPVRLEHPRELPVTILRKEVRPWMPFRIIGIESHSGFSDMDRGFAPFGIGLDLVDRIHADLYKEAKPTLTDLPMNAPEAEAQILSGIFDLEQAKQRWMSGTASVMLVSPVAAEPLHVDFYQPDYAPARRLQVLLDGQPVYSGALPGPGIHRIVTPPQKAQAATSVVTLQVDRTFSAPGDSRKLGIVLFDVGWGR